MEVSHLWQLVVPFCIFGFDGDDATLHIMHIVEILFECHGDNSDINLLVDTLTLETILEDDVGLMSNLHGLFNRLDTSLERLQIGNLLSRFAVTHEQSEEGEEDEEQCQTEEYNTHRKNADAETVGVFTLELGYFTFSYLNIV